MTILRLDHVGVVAHSLEEATEILIDRLGFVLDKQRTPNDEGGYFEPENARIWFTSIGVGETAIEILVPQDRVTGMGKYLDKRGPGFHHLCYSSDDLEADSRMLTARGLQRVPLPPSATAAFFYPKSALGILTELVTDRAYRIHSGTQAKVEAR
jgi:methylmalonyl-CoA/ethylmalonyl-CoA epimerase